MKNIFRLLLLALIALPISSASAQDSSTGTGSLPSLPLFNFQQERSIELNVITAYDEQDNIIYSEIIGTDDPYMNVELPEGIYIDSYRYTESQLREEFGQDGYYLNDLDGDGRIEGFELRSWDRGSISDAYNGDPIRSGVITPGENGTLPMDFSDFRDRTDTEIVDALRERDLGLHNIGAVLGGANSGSSVNNVLNRFISLGGGTDAVDARRALTSASSGSSQIQPFSFTRQLDNFGSAVSRYVNANGDYSGDRYRNGGMGGGYSLAAGAESVRNNRGGLGGLLQDATNGDGTFMGQQTGNIFQGNFNPSGFNPGAVLSGTPTAPSVSGGATPAQGSNGGSSPSITGSTAGSTVDRTPPSAIGVGPR